MKVRNGFVSNSSTSSFIVVGIPIPGDVLWKTKKIRGCRCRIKDCGSDPKFCPKCGCRWIVDNRVPAEGFLSMNGTFRGMQVTQFGGQWFAFVVKAKALDANTGICLDDLANIAAEKEKVKTVLEPIGLWQESNFKVWAGHEQGGF